MDSGRLYRRCVKDLNLQAQPKVMGKGECIGTEPPQQRDFSPVAAATESRAAVVAVEFAAGGLRGVVEPEAGFAVAAPQALGPALPKV